MSKFRPALIGLLASSILLSGCITSMIVGGAAATGIIIADRRSPSMQLTDKTNSITLENRAKAQLNADLIRVNAMSFNQRILITGEVPTQEDKDRVTQIARGITDVKDVVNELIIARPADFNTRSRDSWISSKVRSELTITKNAPSRTIALTTSQGVVYLMGQVTQSEGDIAAQTAASVNGVIRVVKVFDIVTEAQLESGTSKKTSTTTPSNHSTVTTSPLQ